MQDECNSFAEELKELDDIKEIEENDCNCFAKNEKDLDICENLNLTLPECLAHRKRDGSFLCEWTSKQAADDEIT